MTTEERDVVAVWFMRYLCMSYDLFDSEKEAAGFANYLEDEGEGVVIGIQFADGRAVPAKDWTTPAEVRRAWEEQNATRIPDQPRPVRAVRDPFKGERVMVEVTEPDWLGR
jgi:hypothetical protein